MKIFRMCLQQWAVLLIIGLALTGYPHYAQAMSLFMGGEEPKPSTPPSKPAVVKPQSPSGQPNAKAAGQATGAPAQTVVGAPIPAANSPKPMTSPTAPTTGVAGQPEPGGSAPPPAAKPATVRPSTPTPPAQATGSAKEIQTPATNGGAPATSVAEAAEGYTYDPKSRRDPFQSLTRLVKIDKTLAERPPLQRVPLSDLKLLGIMWGGYGYYGLVRTPDGKGYTVKEGTLMGTNNGVISTITDKTVIVSEPSIDITGNKSTKDVVILLRPKEVS